MLKKILTVSVALSSLNAFAMYDSPPNSPFNSSDDESIVRRPIKPRRMLTFDDAPTTPVGTPPGAGVQSPLFFNEAPTTPVGTPPNSGAQRALFFDAGPSTPRASCSTPPRSPRLSFVPDMFPSTMPSFNLDGPPPTPARRKKETQSLSKLQKAVQKTGWQVIDLPLDGREILGEGEFGSVFNSTNSSGHVIAVKVFKNRLGLSTISLQEEVNRQLQAGSLGVAPSVIDGPFILSNPFNADDFSYAFSMEYHPGFKNLKAMAGEIPAADKKSFLEATFINAFKQIRKLHSLGIYHNDIAPENILVNAVGQVLLIDFGVSPSDEGHPEYHAAETFSAKEMNPANLDLISLSVLCLRYLDENASELGTGRQGTKPSLALIQQHIATLSDELQTQMPIQEILDKLELTKK